MRQEIKDRILEIFYENPTEEFTIRKIAKITKIPRATIHKYITEFKKQKIITTKNIAEPNIFFKTKKTCFFMEKIVVSGIIEEIVKKLNPSCIILFGSIRKGESSNESDIDLFVESSTKKSVDLKMFEKRLKHKIQLFVESDIHKLQPHLLNNVVNGIKLYGSFKIK